MPGRCVLSNQVCPQTADPAARRYCPAWWETAAKNETGEVRVLKGCAWSQLPMYLNDYARTGASAAEAAQEARNEIAAAGSNFRALALSVFEVQRAQASERLSNRRGPAPAALVHTECETDVSDDCGGIQQPGFRGDGG